MNTLLIVTCSISDLDTMGFGSRELLRRIPDNLDSDTIKMIGLGMVHELGLETESIEMVTKKIVDVT